MSTSGIISCSTGSASGAALAVIRISGFESVVEFQRSFKKNLSKIQPRKIYLTNILKYDGIKNKILDEIMFSYFQGPFSYSGENMLEMYVHGNAINVDRIISHFVSFYGLNMAKPGEFTLRAIQNGKMSFSQAEGLNALLTANSEFVMSQGLEMLSGELNATYQAIYQYYLKIKAAVDMQIDFSEDVGADECNQQLLNSLNSSLKLLNALYERANFKSSSLIESKIVLMGPPNSGKSSLFNNLLGKNRSIISDIAGTTRDYIEGALTLEGQQFILVDTAGMRVATDILEKQGVERTMALIPNAFLTIYVHNPALDFVENIEEVDLVAVTHIDKTSDVTIRNLKIPFKFKSLIYINIGPIGPGQNSNGSIGPDVASGSIGPVFNKTSIDDVKSLIIRKYKDVTSRNPIVIERQVEAIKEMYENISSLQEAVSKHNKNNDIAILSYYVDRYGRSIQKLMGIVDSEHILNYIFANFCIGK